jgi:hypothetical protein
MYAADQFLRKFLGISSIVDPGILNNYNHEDPTYPIFHIKFAFNPPEAKHPDYVTNRLLSDLKDETSQVAPESAIKFLYNVGEPERAIMLRKFNLALKSISEQTPWYFQGISGIEGLFKHAYPSEGRGEAGLTDAVIDISTLDSIDFRITALKDLYRKAAYDRKYRRWVLPVNMRRFRMTIMVGDARQLAITEDNYSINGKQALQALRDIDIFNASNIGGKLLGKVRDGSLSFVKRLQWWDNHFSCLVFDCQDCEFDMNSFSGINSLSHPRLKDTTLAQSLKIKIGRVIESNTYSLLEYSLSDNLIENFLKSENKSDVIKLSQTLNAAFKPKVPYWNNYQNLERDKGDNKRIITEDGGFGSAISQGANAAAAALGIDGITQGTNLGGGGGILGSLGSIVDFAGDTASEIAQEALGLATEQITKNVFGNDLYRSAAGIGLGILNGDLNQVAQNFVNPAIAGALGINIESSGRPIQPNLRDGIPTKLELVAPNVQKSLSDIQANLSGQGADPRFQSIGRPGGSLFNNPNPTEKLFDQKNIDLQASRVEKEMPQNIEFQTVRKETKINPKKEVLTGATKKTTFDESLINLEGAGKKLDLTPSSANLSGAQPLKDLTPNNADLVGAQPLKDLVPDNADLVGAQPLKDLIPDNADLVGAQPLKDLIPNNADLVGAEPLKDLIPDNADLVGAQPLKDLVPNNADLVGAEPLKELVPVNANLIGAESLKDLVPTSAELTGAEALKKIDPAKVILEGQDPLLSFDQKSITLTGTTPLTKFASANETLVGAKVLTDLAQSKINLEGTEPLNSLSSTNVDLAGKTPLSKFEESKIDLTESKVLRDLPNLKEELISPTKQTSFNETTADLDGIKPQTKFAEDNVNLEGSAIKSSSIKNANLIGTLPISKLNESNVELTGNNKNTVKELGVAELNGKTPADKLSESNVGNMEYNESLTSTSLGKETLLGKEPVTAFSENNIGNMKNEVPNTLSSLGTETLLGTKPLTNLSETNVNLVGATVQNKISEKIELNSASITTKMDKNVRLEGTAPLNHMNDNVELKGAININTTFPSTNINLEGKEGATLLPNQNVELEGKQPQSNTISNAFEGQRTLGINKNKKTSQGNVELEISKPLQVLPTKNVDTETRSSSYTIGQNVFQENKGIGIKSNNQTLPQSRIEFETSSVMGNTTSENVGFETPFTRENTTSENVGFKTPFTKENTTSENVGLEAPSIQENTNYKNVGLEAPSVQENTGYKNVQLGVPSVNTPIREVSGELSVVKNPKDSNSQ